MSLSKNQCLDLSKRIETDLQKKTEQKKYSLQVINGTGFKYLKTMSDFLQVPQIEISQLDQFFSSYLPTIDLMSNEANQSFRKFCSVLKNSKLMRWKKFQFLYTNPEGKGSWIGIFFRKKSNDMAQFYSNHIKCAFQLMPDIFVLRQEESSTFLCFKQTSNTFYIVQKNRGFTRQDLSSIMMVCSAFTHSKAICDADT